MHWLTRLEAARLLHDVRAGQRSVEQAVDDLQELFGREVTPTTPDTGSTSTAPALSG